MLQPAVTILVPNYKTKELTKLCLRLLRKYTDPKLARVIIIDNDSRDESLSYLKTLRWIELIERPAIPGEHPHLAHSLALDSGLAQVTTPYVLSIHTDTLVKHPDWLNFLLTYIEKSPQTAGVGSWKIEHRSWLRSWIKNLERTIQINYYHLVNKTDHKVEGYGKNYYYLRSHCALYRTNLIRQLNLSFSDSGEPAGKVMHKKLIDNGYQMIFLDTQELSRYLDHIDHATMALNPQLGARRRTIKQGIHRIGKRLAAVDADQILNDASLDR